MSRDATENGRPTGTPTASERSPDRTTRVRFDYPRSEDRVSLAVVADAHVTPTHSGTWKVLHRSERQFSSALRLAQRRGVDAVLAPGDLTRDGTPAAVAAADRLVSEVDVPILAVPGNHDPAPDPPAGESALARNWAAFPSHAPFHATVGGVDVLGLDSASRATDADGGVIPDEHRQWLDHTLDDADRPVVLTHHPLGVDWTGLGKRFPPSKFHVAEAGAVRERLTDAGALVVAGHVHWPIAQRVGTRREVVAPATCSYPQAMLVLRVGPDGTTVELLPVSTGADRRDALAHLRSDPVLDGAYVDLAERSGGLSDLWVRNLDDG